MPWRIALLGVIAATLAGSARADDRWWPTTGFGADGVVEGVPVDAIAAAPDGTVILAGAGGRAVSLERYSADGRPIGFGPRGKSVALSTGVDECRPGLAVRSDGTILVACGETVAALRPGGAVKAITTIAGANFDSVAVGFLDRTVAAGNTLLRLNADGSIDASFARTTLQPAASSVLVDGGRTLVLAGGSIRGYDDYGALDTSFGTNGTATFPGFTATSIGAYSHWIVAGGSLGNEAAVVRFIAGGTVDRSFGKNGVVAWGLDRYIEKASVVALGVRAGGAVDTAVDAIHIADVYNSYEHPEEWLVQRVTGTGTLDASSTGPPNHIDPTEECLQSYPVSLAEQPDGKTLVTGVSCREAFDYTTYYLLERYDRWLAPDVGLALRARVTATQAKRTAVIAHVAVNGPCRLILRIQQLDGNDPIGYWLSPTRIDVAHGPAVVRLRLKYRELLPHHRYAVVVSAYDARGYSTARAVGKPIGQATPVPPSPQ